MSPLDALPGAPVEPDSARSVSIDSEELFRRLGSDEELQLIDVREPFEAQIAKIAGSELIPLAQIASSLDRLRRDIPVILYCHHDSRSHYAAGVLLQQGISNVQWLEGGIDAYSTTVDPTLARY